MGVHFAHYAFVTSGFKKDVIPLIHLFGGTKKAGKKKLVETITRNSLHNLT
jgi:hypothetical protein